MNINDRFPKFGIRKSAVEIGNDKNVALVISRLKQALADRGVVKVEGTWGSFAPLLAAHISKMVKRPILFIRPHIDDADKAADDLITFGAENVMPFAAWEEDIQAVDATDEVGAERTRIVIKVAAGERDFVIPASVIALLQPVPKMDVLEKNCLELKVGRNISPQAVSGWLVDNGFESTDRIDLPGQFAQRGGIIDIFAPLTAAAKSIERSRAESGQGSLPIRIEFFADTIETIRLFDPDTQRSTGELEGIGVISTVAKSFRQEREIFSNILPADTIVVLEEPADIQGAAETYRRRSEDSDSSDKSESGFSWQELYAGLEKFTRLHICRFGEADSDFIRLDVGSVQQYQLRGGGLWSGHKELLGQLAAEAGGGKTVYLYCESEAEISRISEILQQEETGGIPAGFKIVKGFVHQGFTLGSTGIIVVTHHELFGQSTIRRVQRPFRQVAAVDTLEDLKAGDYVVHASYGIGKFLGVKTIQEKDAVGEYLTIQFADNVKIHLSVGNIALVQKYIGTSPARPKLSKVGSKRWQRQKEKVEKSVTDLAAELLEVQAKRQLAGGFAFGADSNWQREFEESFAYQETPDQTATIAEIKADMQRPIAMDRLLCGDVGYGKTELAMRAAFKAVEAGRQVAVLVPTTVLSVQHGRTFTERFADFPVSVEVLNRFKTSREAAEIIERTRGGKVDMLIGTHRLLSRDIGFKDLGLLIIDEEQRFGVEHKERLKKLRVNVDILTMTATPIPRTLHLSLLGLRDISSLATPPLDRRSIVTVVCGYSDEAIKKAILRELERQGQVFFLHNRVQTIDKKAFSIEKLLEGSGARIGIAHGRMSKQGLERTMIDFVEGKIDVLVCTTIIESGLDIPNANTIFIDNADRFGLAELHQLRGRVGRYKHKAYAYLLLPRNRPITPSAVRRLKAIEEFSQLGAGFKIALRDLEIRGAGNILGPEQSGHIQLVGYQMYCQLLADAVGRLENRPVEKVPAVSVDIGIAAYVPKTYISSDRLRMEVYRKVAVAKSDDELKTIESQVTDMFGPVPDEVRLFFNLAQIRIAAGRAGMRAVTASGQKLLFTFFEKIKRGQESMFDGIKGRLTLSDAQTVCLDLPKNYFEPGTLMNILRKIFKISGF